MAVSQPNENLSDDNSFGQNASPNETSAPVDNGNETKDLSESPIEPLPDNNNQINEIKPETLNVTPASATSQYADLSVKSITIPLHLS